MSKILVVDDDPDIVRALAIRLRAEGHEVLTAHDVDAGAIAAREERPDLAILDVSMPGGNGLDMAGRLQADATTLGTPFIFITASRKSEVRLHAEEIGAVGFFEKPYEADELIGLVRRTLDRDARS